MAASRRVLSPQEVIQLLNDLPEDVSEIEDDNSLRSESDEVFVPPVDSSDDAISEGSTANDDQGNLLSSKADNRPNTSRGMRTRRRGRGRGGGDQARTADIDGGASRPRDTFEPGTKILGTDGMTEWTVLDVHSSASGRFQQQNVLKEKPGPSPFSKRYITDDSCTSSWRLLFSEKMLKHIQKCTIAEARRKLNSNDWDMTLDELDAFIAIMYLRGAQSRFIPVDELWSKRTGPPIYSETMSRDKFREIMRYLRFDEKTTRRERLQTDKFALASEIWNPFIQNSIQCYIPGPYLTVDEQLFPSKARCKFTQYMANKPDKFGIKFWLLADVDSKYLCNGFPYLGKDEMRPTGTSLGEHMVMKLAEPFLKKGRNVTTDNFFTSVSLAKKLRSANTSLVGTVNRVKREIPVAVKNSRAPLHDTKLLRTDNMTLTVYQGKVRKNVSVLSTLHNSVDILPGEKKLPETIQFYNDTKYGVDVVDAMARKYSTRTATRRWPVHVFQNVLDLCAINAWILFKEVTNSKISRRDFILELADDLRSKYAKTRARGKDLAESNSESDEEPVEKKEKRSQCHVTKCGNKTQQMCKSCLKPTCGKHAKIVKIKCVQCS